MSTLAEIQAAVDALPAEQKEELLLFLAARLRGARAALPDPRTFPPEKISRWIEEDESEMRRFREGR